MELIKVAEALVEKIRKDYPNDIAIIALCGSYIYNDTHTKSDLDFYFIPKTDRGYEMSQSFILEDIGFDFWGMSWQRAESLAKYNETNTSIISDAQIIYYASQEDLDRFNQLRVPGNKPILSTFIEKAYDQMNICYDCFFTILEAKDDFSKIKYNAMWILYFTSFAVALLNKSCVKRGGRNLLKEITAMQLVPADYDVLFNRIVLSNDIHEIRESAQQVILNTRALLQENKITPEKKLKEKATGYYEELKSIYNKLIHECEMGNFQGIMLAIARIDHSISDLLDGTGHDYHKFPNLFLASSHLRMDEIIQAVNAHEARLVDILEKEGIPIASYKNMDEFRFHLNHC